MRLVPLVLLLLLCSAVQADEGEVRQPSPVDRAIAAHKAKDSTAVLELASREGANLWVLAEQVQQRRGGHEAALALAAASEDADHEALTRYLQSRKGLRHSRDALAAMRDAIADVAAKRYEAALLLFDGAKLEPESVYGIDRATRRVQVLLALRRTSDACEALVGIADRAERIGWRWRAARALRRAIALARSGLDFGKARRLSEQRYHLLRGRRELAEAARECTDQAILNAVQFRYDPALSWYARAIKEHEAIDATVEAERTRLNWGHMHSRLGEHAKALTHIEQALARLRRSERPDWSCIADALSHLGSIRQNLGQYPKALANRKECLKIAQRLMSERPSPTRGDLGRVAQALGNRGNTFMLLGEHAAAEDDLQAALEIFEGKLKSPYYIAVANASLAELRLHERLFIKALQRIRGAIAGFEKAHAALGTAASRVTEGHILARLDRSDEALEAYALAREDAKALRAYDVVVSAMGGEAALRLELGQGQQALAIVSRAVEHLAGPLSHLAQAEGGAARASRLHLYETGIRAAQTVGDAKACLQALESGRAGQLLDALGGRAAMQRVAVPPDFRERLREAQDAEDRAHTRFKRSVGTSFSEEREARVVWDAAQARLVALHASKERLKKQKSQLVYPRAAASEKVSACLAPGEALVEYSLLPGAALAVVVTAAGPRIVELAASDKIRAACAEVEDVEQWEKAGLVKSLGNLLIKPLKLGAGIQRVLVAPDGVLTYMPFGMLLPKREVAYVPSGSVYRILHKARALRGEGVLAVGDPLYESLRAGGGPAVYSTAGERPLGRLKASGDEVRAIGSTGLVLVRGEATEAKLREKLAEAPKRLRALHLAVHGLADTEVPALSYLMLTPHGKDDGYLTALKVFQMEVDADLVVLSACQSAVGKVVRGEGLSGLVRAFMFAGSPRVIASLWKVDDEATKILMQEFYRRWNPKTGDRESAAKALKGAQEYLKSIPKWNKPRYWAAWVLWGLPK